MNVTIKNESAESLLYQIQSAQDEVALTVACFKIPPVAREGTEEYQDLINASAARRIELEQQRMSRN